MGRMQLLAWLVTALLLAPAEGFMGSALVGGRSSRQHRMTRMVVAADDTTRVDAINGFSSTVRAKLISGSNSQQFAAIMEEFLEGYTRCAVAAGTPADTFQFNLGTLAGLVPGVLSNPHKFELFHRAMREPLDMYQWGNSFFAPMIEFDNSHLEGLENLEQIKGMLERGENVFLLANHQTEADPQVISLLLERAGYGCVAEKVINVAGHRVTTDPMAVPFSMGRNLFCIYSKKYMENPPEDKPAKQNHNMRTLKKMAELLAQPEGQIIWVAPSGGRDRPDPATGNFVVAPFDPKSVGVFRLMAAKTRKVCKTHFFPFAMWTNKLMPPPDTVQKDLGERRVAERGPVSIAVCDEVDGEGLDMQQFAAAVEASVKAGYAKLDAQQKAQAKQQ